MYDVQYSAHDASGPVHDCVNECDAADGSACAAGRSIHGIGNTCGSTGNCDDTTRFGIYSASGFIDRIPSGSHRNIGGDDRNRDDGDDAEHAAYDDAGIVYGNVSEQSFIFGGTRTADRYLRGIGHTVSATCGGTDTACFGVYHLGNVIDCIPSGSHRNTGSYDSTCDDGNHAEHAAYDASNAVYDDVGKYNAVCDCDGTASCGNDDAYCAVITCVDGVCFAGDCNDDFYSGASYHDDGIWRNAQHGYDA